VNNKFNAELRLRLFASQEVPWELTSRVEGRSPHAICLKWLKSQVGESGKNGGKCRNKFTRPLADLHK